MMHYKNNNKFYLINRSEVNKGIKFLFGHML